MSELKTRFIDDTCAEYFNTGKHELAQIYLKSEADKVIAELNAKINSLQKDKEIIRDLYRGERDDCRIWASRAIHHKYKRCLDKAEMCESEEKRLDAIAPLFNTDRECWEYNSNYWVKWRQRWLALADKLKKATRNLEEIQHLTTEKEADNGND